jgi:hypothetical protein
MKSIRGLRKHAVRITALVLAGLLVLGVLAAAIFSAALAEAPDQCEMTLTMLEELSAVSVLQKVTYTNRTDHPLDQVVFQLAANALRRKATAPYEAIDDAYPEGFTAGGVEFNLVKFNDQPADWGVQREDESLLRVACSLEPAEQGVFEFQYELLLPRALGALGTGEIGWRLSGFYPLPAVWDGAGFAAESISPVGGALMAGMMDYSVSLNAPDTWQVAACGAIEADRPRDGRRDTRIELADARFFALAISRRYTKVEIVCQSGVRIVSYANDRAAARRAADAAGRAVDVYGAAFGAYPRAELVVAQADLAAGFAQSGLILLPESLYAFSARAELEYQAALLTAGQWFGDRVASNPAQAPWLCESLSAYAALIYCEKTYGRDRYLKEMERRVTPAVQVTIPGGVSVDSETIAFGTVSDYEAVVMGRGAAVLHEIRAHLGDAAFFDGLRLYAAQNDGGIAAKAQFVAALDEASGRDTAGLVDDLLHSIAQYIGQTVDWSQ